MLSPTNLSSAFRVSRYDPLRAIHPWEHRTCCAVQWLSMDKSLRRVSPQNHFPYQLQFQAIYSWAQRILTEQTCDSVPAGPPLSIKWYGQKKTIRSHLVEKCDSSVTQLI